MNPINFITAGSPVATLYPDGKFFVTDDKGEAVEKYNDWKDAIKRYSGEEVHAPGPKFGSKAMLVMLQKLMSAESFEVVDKPATAPDPASGNGRTKAKALKATGKVVNDAGVEVEVSGTTIILDPDDIIAGPNPRGITPNPEGMAEWMRMNADVTGEALIQNIVVGLPVLTKGKKQYPLYAGWTRYEGARLNKASKPGKPQYYMLRAVIVDVSEDERRALGLMENLGRTEMNPVARARAYQSLIDKDNWTQKDVAKRFGFSNAHISNMLSILTLPKNTQVQGEEGTLDQTMLIKLSKLSESDRDVAVAAIDEQLAAGAPVNPLVDVVKEAVRAAKHGPDDEDEDAGDDEDLDTDEENGDEGDEEAEKETSTSKDVKRLSRKEIMDFLEDNHLPGADPSVFAICEVMIKVFEGDRKPGWGVTQLKMWARKDATAVDTGLISEGGKPKAKRKAA